MQPYKLVRDERDGVDLKSPAVDSILDGDLDEFMTAYLRYKVARQNRTKAKA